MEYPSSPKKPYLSKDHTSEDVAKYNKELKVYEKEMPIYREKRKAYSVETYRLHQLFKQDALKELGLSKHKKADKLFEVAWEEGHSNGLNEVWIYMETFSELLI